MAQRLGVQDETLDDILQLLVARGMLKVNDCSLPETGHCSSCPHTEGCSSSAQSIVEYHVTQRGRRFAGQ